MFTKVSDNTVLRQFSKHKQQMHINVNSLVVEE